jgi:hypothetical protein
MKHRTTSRRRIHEIELLSRVRATIWIRGAAIVVAGVHHAYLVYNPWQSPYDRTTGNTRTCLVRPACL